MIPPNDLKGLTPRARALVEEHAWLPRLIARRVFGHRVNAQLDELVGWGNLGLVQAAVRFDPERNEAFATFAWTRVSGAMLDGFTKDRRHHRLKHAMEAAGDEFQRGCPASLSTTPAPRVRAALRDEAFGLAAARLLGSLAGLRTLGPEEALGAHEQWERAITLLTQVVDGLPERDRTLLRLHYFESVPLAEVATRLQPVVPYSTCTRYHRDALVRAGQRLRRLGVEDAPDAPGERG